MTQRAVSSSAGKKTQPNSQAQGRHNSLNKQPAANVLPGDPWGGGGRRRGDPCRAELWGWGDTHGGNLSRLLSILKLFLTGAREVQPGQGGERATSVPL